MSIRANKVLITYLLPSATRNPLKVVLEEIDRN